MCIATPPPSRRKCSVYAAAICPPRRIRWRLDASVTQKGTTASLVLGVISALVLGVGMCCCMVWGDKLFIPGIIVGLVGIVGIALAYPVYKRITEKERERIAPEIIRLTDELMK